MTAVRVNPTEGQMHVGDYYSAAWTASSSSANLTTLTDWITVPAGLYLISFSLPKISTTTFACGLADASGLFSKGIHIGTEQTSKSFPLKLNADTRLRLAAAQGAACTFSYTERGGLYAVRLA